MRGLVAVISDTHSGSKLAACRPGIELQETLPNGETTTYQEDGTESSRYLYKCFAEDVDNITALAKRSKGYDDVAVFHLGDVIEGDKYMRELIASQLSAQFTIANDLLGLLVEKKYVKWMRIVSGTGSHVLGEGSAEYMISEYLKAKYNKDISAFPHWMIEAFGKRWDLAHHGGYPGSRNWLRGNVLRLYCLSLMMDELDAGREPPDVVLRAHFHQLATETVTKRQNGNLYETQIALAPSYKLLDDYSRKASRSASSVVNGTLVYEIDNGRITRHEFLHKMATRRVEVLK